MTPLEAHFWRQCGAPGDIREHLPVLYRYASGCRHVTEFGTRAGCSTTAFAWALPEELHCYDLDFKPEVDEVQRLAEEAGVKFVRHQQDTRTVIIAPTDLLFIDTAHREKQVEAELLNAGLVKKYLIFHDTEHFGEIGDDGEIGSRGIWHAIKKFLRSDSGEKWRMIEHRPNCFGLTVLARIGGGDV